MTVLVAIILTAGVLMSPPGDPGIESAAAVVVLPTEIDSTQRDLASTQDALADLFGILLQGDSRFRMVERDALRTVLDEQKLQANGLTDAASTARLGRLIHADFLVTSAIAIQGSKIRLSVQLVEVDGARIVQAAEQSGPMSQLDAMFQHCVRSLAEGLGVHRTALKPEELDRSPRASLHFMRGLAFYHEGLYLRAQVEFLKVSMIEPLHEGATAYIAKCFYDIGETEHARLTAEKLLERFPASTYRSEVELILSRDGKTTRE